ncbi:MAG: tetratricopeptide repeat protein [Bacteroidales bacterium]|nr:tetratricopeptide repeat protein [Bacteroidales bacterium]
MSFIKIKWFLNILLFAFLFSQCRTYKAPTDEASELMKKAYQLLVKKQYQKSIYAFTELIQKYPEYAEAYAYRGLCKYFLKDYEGAINDYNKALEIQPNFAEVYDLRGIARGELGDSKGACEDWRRAFELGLKDAFALIKVFCWDEEKQKVN